MNNNLLEQQINRYLYQVQKGLTCTEESKRAFIDHLKSSVEDYAAQTPNCTIENIIQFSGEASQVSKNLMESVEPSEIARIHQRKKITIISCTVLAAIMVVILMSLFFKSRGTHDGLVTESTIVYVNSSSQSTVKEVSL